MTPYELLLIGLATWRVAYLIAIEDGPFDLLIRLRSALGGYDLDSKGRPKSWTGRGITCIYCVSFWTAGVFTLVVALGGTLALVPLAASTVALYAQRLIKRE